MSIEKTSSLQYGTHEGAASALHIITELNLAFQAALLYSVQETELDEALPLFTQLAQWQTLVPKVFSQAKAGVLLHTRRADLKHSELEPFFHLGKELLGSKPVSSDPDDYLDEIEQLLSAAFEDVLLEASVSDVVDTWLQHSSETATGPTIEEFHDLTRELVEIGFAYSIVSGTLHFLTKLGSATYIELDTKGIIPPTHSLAKTRSDWWVNTSPEHMVRRIDYLETLTRAFLLNPFQIAESQRGKMVRVGHFYAALNKVVKLA